MPRLTCEGTVGFVFEVCGKRPRTRGTTKKNCSQLAAGLQDLERLRAEARACPVPPPSHNEQERNDRISGIALGSGTIEKKRNQWMGKTNSSQFMEVVGDSRSSRMASSINEENAKRSCVEPVS